MINTTALNWENAPDILKVEEIAELLRVDKSIIYELCRGDNFPCFRINRGIRVHKEILLKWIEEQSQVETI